MPDAITMRSSNRYQHKGLKSPLGRGAKDNSGNHEPPIAVVADRGPHGVSDQQYVRDKKQDGGQDHSGQQQRDSKGIAEPLRSVKPDRPGLSGDASFTVD